MARQEGAGSAKYLRIADALRSRIESGQYAPGGPLPPKRQLQEEFGGGINTIERAIRVLREENLVESIQGSGTFVRAQPPAEAEPPTADDVWKARIEAELGRMWAVLMNLHHATGVPFPYEDNGGDQQDKRRAV